MKSKRRGHAAEPKEIVTVTFRPNGGGLQAIMEWEKTGYDRTILINTLLTKYGDQALKDLPPMLAQLGILPKSDPLTPTSHNAVNNGMALDDRDKKNIGVVAQMAERVNGIHEVGGSIPPGSTNSGRERVRLGGYVDNVCSGGAMPNGSAIISRSE